MSAIHVLYISIHIWFRGQRYMSCLLFSRAPLHWIPLMPMLPVTLNLRLPNKLRMQLYITAETYATNTISVAAAMLAHTLQRSFAYRPLELLQNPVCLCISNFESSTRCIQLMERLPEIFRWPLVEKTFGR